MVGCMVGAWWVHGGMHGGMHGGCMVGCMVGAWGMHGRCMVGCMVGAWWNAWWVHSGVNGGVLWGGCMVYRLMYHRLIFSNQVVTFIHNDIFTSPSTLPIHTTCIPITLIPSPRPLLNRQALFRLEQLFQSLHNRLCLRCCCELCCCCYVAVVAMLFLLLCCFFYAAVAMLLLLSCCCCYNFVFLCVIHGC